MNTHQTINLSEYTKLPVRVIAVADKMLPDVLVRTPHRGHVQVSLKKEHYPFIFGSVTQTDKHAIEVLQELDKLEAESIDYLIAEWKKTL